MPKYLMLDVDGVLVDGRPQDRQRWDHDLQRDLGLSSQDLAEAFFERDWAEIVVGKKDLLPALSQSLSHIGAAVSAQALVDYWFRNDARIQPEVLEDCRAARRRGVSVYLTTNQEHMRAAYLMQDMGLRTEVDGILYSAKLGAKKPQAAFFSKAAEAIRAAPDDMLLVDDTSKNVEAAREAGWRAAHWDGRQRLAQVLQEGFGP